jgi:hypothetical protein
MSATCASPPASSGGFEFDLGCAFHISRRTSPLFSCPAAQVVRLSRDAPPAPLPEGAIRGVQRLATLVATQQQRRQQQQQQTQPAADAAVQQQQPAAAGAGALQQDIGTPLFGRQAHVTTIYTPAPAKGASKSAADRQPLRFMSLRQQQQAREEARRQAVMMVGGVETLGGSAGGHKHMGGWVGGVVLDWLGAGAGGLFHRLC